MRDRLIELFSQFADSTYNSSGTIIDGTKVDDVADYLLENGVVVLDKNNSVEDMIELLKAQIAVLEGWCKK